MIPAPFDYVRPARSTRRSPPLAEHGDEAKLLAGGHSLLPMMKLRLAVPACSSTSARMPALSLHPRGRRRGRDRRADPAPGPRDVRASSPTEVPLLPHVAGLVGDPQVRHRGTIGGSLAHADPAADLPAAVSRSERRPGRCAGPGGERRRSPPTDFFAGFFETALVGRTRCSSRSACRACRSAPLGLREVRPARQRLGRSSRVAACDGRVALANMGATPLRAGATEQALADGASDRGRRRARRRGHLAGRRTCTPTRSTAGTSPGCSPGGP